MAIMIIIIAILAFVGSVWFLIQQNSQVSDDSSTQRINPAPAPSKARNSFGSISNAQNSASTNILAPLPPPAGFVTTPD
jgi:hypothetical protein